MSRVGQRDNTAGDDEEERCPNGEAKQSFNDTDANLVPWNHAWTLCAAGA